MKVLSVFLVCILVCSGNAWDNDDLEIFDLVEEVNQNFYTVLDIEKDASTSDVRKAYRKLSLALHPDKNRAPDAEVKFRQLVAVYEIIKDAAKRQKYDEVLEKGLPDWRQAIYYYRRVRKMGLAEMLVILFIIVSVGQYCVGWAVYIEHKYNAEKYLSSKLKKQQKKLKKTKGDGTSEIENILSVIPTPSVKNTLPFQIPRFIWTSIVSLPQLYYAIKEHIEEQRRRKEEESLRVKDEEEEESAEIVPRGPRRRKGGPFTIPEYSGNDGPDGANYSSNANDAAASLAQARREMRLAQKSAPAQSSGLWTDDDIVELIRLVKKYPTGTIDRWEKIAEAMERPVANVTHMAKKVKEDCYRVPAQDRENEEIKVDADSALMGKSKKVKTRGGKLAIADSDITVAEIEGQGQNMSSAKDWTQLQQKKLEAGLLKYPKGSVQDRWEKIASCVPGKSKEECMLRFKYLYEKVQKEKKKEAAAPVENEEIETGDAAEVPSGQTEASEILKGNELQEPCIETDSNQDTGEVHLSDEGETESDSRFKNVF